MSRRLLDSVAFYSSARPEELFFFSVTILVPATDGDNTHLSQTAADGTGSHVSAGHWALAGIVFKSQRRSVMELSDQFVIVQTHPIHIINVAAKNRSQTCQNQEIYKPGQRALHFDLYVFFACSSSMLRLRFPFVLFVMNCWASRNICSRISFSPFRTLTAI